MLQKVLTPKHQKNGFKKIENSENEYKIFLKSWRNKNFKL